MKRRAKGILLYSGGLDSLLAGKLLLEQDVDLTGLHCVLPFVAPDANLEELPSMRRIKRIGIPTLIYRCDNDYISMVKNPPHGYGKRINPCIDCKIFFLKKAAALMKKLDADFIATGEVVGQRPMSQLKNMLRHIEKKSGLEGRLLRPLSAKIMTPTIPEEAGLIDRNKLLDISGRSRKAQMELAIQYGISDYSSPAGGCLFTDPNYSKRVYDLFMHKDSVLPEDLYMLTLGRHFRINDSIKIVVARNEFESHELNKYSYLADYIYLPDFKGPTVMVNGTLMDADVDIIRAMISRYGTPTEEEDTISIQQNGVDVDTVPSCTPIDDGYLESIRI